MGLSQPSTTSDRITDAQTARSKSPLYYADLEFTCEDCGGTEIWTAEQQQHRYESGDHEHTPPTRCESCRQE